MVNNGANWHGSTEGVAESDTQQCAVSSIFKFYFYWDIIDIEHCICLKCKTCWFDTVIHWNMITTAALANISITSHNYGEQLRSSLLATWKFTIQLLLSITAVQCIRSSGLIYIHTSSKFVPLSNTFPSPLPLSVWLLPSVSTSLAFFRFHILVILYSICLFLTYLA